MIPIIQTEADFILKNVKDNKLKKASARKRHGGKTYYVLNDDYPSLSVLAKLREYKSVKQLLEDN